MKNNSKTRSPAYPFISLREAIFIAKKLYASDKSFNKESIAKILIYSRNSSIVNRIISVLKQYDLLSYSNKSYSFTKLALQIITNDDKPCKIQAALSPKIFNRLWYKFNIHSSDSSLKNFLNFKGYTDGATDAIIDTYKETLRFAGLTGNENATAFPILLPNNESSIQILIPKMSAENFKYFKQLLELYKSEICE